ncbi:MAG: CoA-acylating methylmalonate-semialdehyde dehydrogenase [Opitutales bacterium]
MTQQTAIRNFIKGVWADSASDSRLAVPNPATGETIAETPLSSAAEVGSAVEAASAAYREWRRVPVGERIQPLFRLKMLLEEHLDELARTITLECGKTLAESKGELRRAIENVETAAGMPMLMQGDFLEDIARGIDESMIRQPLGVCAAIVPFNFPGMIPFWFLPYAVATGNTFVLKPSERVPLTMQRVFALLQEAGFPDGVVNLVNGDRAVVEALIDHPEVKAVSFVGSSQVAQAVYGRAAANGKRAQCQGGAKNPLVVLPDADLETTTRIIADSAFGCAGQRCLAASLAVTVGQARDTVREAISAAAAKRKVGFGLEDGVDMGPVISAASRDRILRLIGEAEQEGARVTVDGRQKSVDGYRDGYFLHPTVLDGLDPDGNITGTEIFGPVLGLMHAETLDDAIDLINRGTYGNMACLFTRDGASARKFRSEVDAGNVGINIGVAAPMAWFPFSGWKGSFFGDLHGQARHAVEFFTQTKVVVERWPRAWSRQF